MDEVHKVPYAVTVRKRYGLSVRFSEKPDTLVELDKALRLHRYNPEPGLPSDRWANDGMTAYRGQQGKVLVVRTGEGITLTTDFPDVRTRTKLTGVLKTVPGYGSAIDEEL